MPKLFTTFGRAALVALGLAVAPAAFAQTGLGNLTCPTGWTPVVSGTEVTCQVVCSGNNVANITVNGNVASATCQDPGGGPVAPSGCKITANPTSGGPSATNVGLTLSCTSGTLPIDVDWSGSAPGNCPSSMDALSKSCTVSSVSQTTTWTVSQFSNTAGNGSGNSNKSATFNYNAGGGGGDFAGCAGKSAVKVSDAYPITSGGYLGGVGAGQWVSVKMKVPSDANTKRDRDFFGSGVYGGAPRGVWAISETACDVDNPIVNMTKSSPPGFLEYEFGGLSPDFGGRYDYGPAGSQYNPQTGAGSKTMEIGKTYYLNIRVDSCAAEGGCSWSSVKLP